MQLVDGAVHFPSSRLLCVADLHLGYEAELRSRGAHIPSSENQMLVERIASMVDRTDPRTIVLNGDVKHSFGRIHDSDWRHLRRLLETIGDRHIVIVSGNHDVLLGPLAEKFDVQVVPYHRDGDTLFMHGDALPDIDLSGIERIVIGHEHPAISITRGPRTEIVKCYLIGRWKSRELVVLPSMFSLTEGTDVLREKLHSPFLDQDISSFRVYALDEGTILPFGSVGDVDRLGRAERL